MNILITGAAGFIGSYLINELIKEHKIGTLLMPGEKLEHPEGIEIFIGDITRPETLEDACAWPDIVIHCAGVIQANKVEDYYLVNGRGTENLRDVLEKVNPKLKLFILSSSLSVSGPVVDINRPIDETSVFNPIDHYGRSKVQAEKAMLTAKFPNVILRLPSIYGGGSKEYIVLMKVMKNRLSPRLGTANYFYSMLHVQDLVKCISIIIQNYKKVQPVYFLSDGVAHSTEMISAAVKSLFKHRVYTLTIPLFLFKMIVYIIYGFNKITGKSSLLNPEKILVLTSSAVCSPERFHSQFGNPGYISLQKGFEQTYEWYQKKGWI